MVPRTKPKKTTRRVFSNCRERWRQQNVNEAFHELRLKLPTDPVDKKLSKCSILTRAIAYIKLLKQVIDYQEREARQLYNDLNRTTIESPPQPPFSTTSNSPQRQKPSSTCSNLCSSDESPTTTFCHSRSQTMTIKPLITFNSKFHHNQTDDDELDDEIDYDEFDSENPSCSYCSRKKRKLDKKCERNICTTVPPNRRTGITRFECDSSVDICSMSSSISCSSDVD